MLSGRMACPRPSSLDMANLGLDWACDPTFALGPMGPFTPVVWALLWCLGEQSEGSWCGGIFTGLASVIPGDFGSVRTDI